MSSYTGVLQANLEELLQTTAERPGPHSAFQCSGSLLSELWKAFSHDWQEFCSCLWGLQGIFVLVVFLHSFPLPNIFFLSLNICVFGSCDIGWATVQRFDKVVTTMPKSLRRVTELLLANRCFWESEGERTRAAPDFSLFHRGPPSTQQGVGGLITAPVALNLGNEPITAHLAVMLYGYFFPLKLLLIYMYFDYIASSEVFLMCIKDCIRHIKKFHSVL